MTSTLEQATVYILDSQGYRNEPEPGDLHGFNTVGVEQLFPSTLDNNRHFELRTCVEITTISFISISATLLLVPSQHSANCDPIPSMS